MSRGDDVVSKSEKYLLETTNALELWESAGKRKSPKNMMQKSLKKRDDGRKS